jgi:hypothetical protein
MRMLISHTMHVYICILTIHSREPLRLEPPKDAIDPPDMGRLIAARVSSSILYVCMYGMYLMKAIDLPDMGQLIAARVSSSMLYVCLHMYVCMFAHVCMYVCTCMYVCIYTYVYVCVYVCMYACMHVPCTHA